MVQNSKEQHHAGIPETEFGTKYLKTCATMYALWQVRTVILKRSSISGGLGLQYRIQDVAILKICFAIFGVYVCRLDIQDSCIYVCVCVCVCVRAYTRTRDLE